MATFQGAAPAQATAAPPPAPPQGGATPSTLAGNGPADSGQPPPDPNGDEGLKVIVQTIRQMQLGMTELARQFPDAAPALRAAMSGLRAALRLIIANPTSPEPQGPDIGG